MAADVRLQAGKPQANDGSVAEPKTARSRRVISLAHAALRALRILQATQKLAAGGAWSEHYFVFADDGNMPWRVADMSRRFRPIAAAAGLGPDVHPHTIRHSYASQALKGGVPVTTVSANLGHSSTATTLTVYAHHIPSAEDTAARVMQRVLEGQS